MADKIRICSLNCQGLGDHTKRRDVLNYLSGMGVSIICLQDTHFSKNNERLIMNEWGYTAVLNSFSSNSRGVGIFFKNNFEFEIHRTFNDASGNIVLIDIEIFNRRITLVNIYGPNKDNPEFYCNVEKLVTNFGNIDVIVVGDWNLLLNPEIDGYNYKHLNNPKARLQVLQLMNNLNLFDVWREENEGVKIYTWKRKLKDGGFQMGRLDFFLVSQSLITLCCDENILPGYRSDHSLIEITLDFNKNAKRSRTFWKFNNSLLYNIDFVKEVKESILSTKKQYAALVYSVDNISEVENELYVSTINPQLFLEIILLNIRSVSIAFSSALKKKENDRTNSLNLIIEELEKSDPVANYEEIIKLKLELQELRENKLKGALLRSKARWVEKGEKPSKFFCNLENRNFVSKRITSLIDNNGEELKSPSEIKNEVFNFYNDLYRSREFEIENVVLDNLLSFEVPKLSEEQSYSLEGKITHTEATTTLKKYAE